MHISICQSQFKEIFQCETPCSTNNNSTGVVTIISRPSVSNVWFQQSEDAWLPNRFQTWSPEDQQKDFNQTIVEGEHFCTI